MNLPALTCALCALFFVAQSRIPEDIGDTLHEMFIETNHYIAKHGFDEMDIPPNIYNGPFYSFDIIEGKIGNFSSAQLIGEPITDRINIGKGITQIYVDMNMGLAELTLQVNYSARFLDFILSSGSLDMIILKSALNTEFVITTRKNGKCGLDMKSVRLKSLGTVVFHIRPEGFMHWIIQKFLELAVKIAVRLFSRTIENNFTKITQQERVRSIMEKVVCRYF